MSSTPHKKNVVENASIQADGNVHIGDIAYNFNDKEVKIPHLLTNNIPTNADHILGRATELAQAKDHLAQHQATVLFNGIGGIGKTALASKYMALYGSEYKHLAWITVQSTLAEAFTNNATLLASLQITQQVQDYIAAKQLDKAFEYLFHQLNLLAHTLVVIDNANDLDDLDQYKNWFDTAHCHFLITSRSQPSEWATVEVDSLPEDEAVRLFRKLHPSVSADDEAIKSLLSKLFYHTLLIELVAKAGASTGIPFADLQTMIETQFIHHQSLNEVPLPTGKHGSVVATNLKKAKIEDYIWLIFSQVKGLDEGSKHLLKAMALLPVATPFDLDFLKAHFAFFNISDAVVQLDAIYAEVYLKKIMNAIAYDNTNPEHNLLAKKQFEPFAERLSNLFFEQNTEWVSEILDWLGYLKQQFGFYEKSAFYRKRALEIAKQVYDNEHEIVLAIQNNLANDYTFLGKYTDAAKLLESALPLLKKRFGLKHRSVISCQSNLGEVYLFLERNQESVQLFQEALISSIVIYGQDHSMVGIAQSNLANALTKVGQLAFAARLFESSLNNAVQNLGYTHPNMVIRLSNLGGSYINLGLLDKAKPFLEDAFYLSQIVYGQQHPYTQLISQQLSNLKSQ